MIKMIPSPLNFELDAGSIQIKITFLQHFNEL